MIYQHKKKYYVKFNFFFVGNLMMWYIYVAKIPFFERYRINNVLYLIIMKKLSSLLIFIILYIRKNGLGKKMPRNGEKS